METVDTRLNLRRMRQNRWVRDLCREYRFSVDQFIQPLFVVEGLKEREAVPGLVGTYRETSESLLKTIEADLEAGVRKFLLFPVPALKNKAMQDPGKIPEKIPGKIKEDFIFKFNEEQIYSIKKRFGSDLFLITDICLCSSTEHGHCGILNAERNHVENGITVEALTQMALVSAQAGVDCVAPSDMMDGRVKAFREVFDKHGLDKTLIMSYSAKFHSKFYGPFRVAADSAPRGEALRDRALRDRATYQIDPGTPRDALLSSLRDEQEGADILMVKPGMPYLDVLYQLSSQIKKPWAVYEVSGEYAAIEALAEKGLMNGPAAHIEAWTAFFRAGASMVISYGARYVGKYLNAD